MSIPENNDTSSSKRALQAIKTLQSKIESLESEKSEPIAIIGIGCRFPGGSDTPEKFWDLLKNGRHGITEHPAERWDTKKYYHPDPEKEGKTSSRFGGFLDDADKFDPQFFNIASRET